MPFRRLETLLKAVSSLTKGDNPIVQAIYTTDPAPAVYNDRPKNWHVYSSDMANWQGHGSPLKLSDFTWAGVNTNLEQVIARNNKFCYYVPIHQNSGAMAMGVAVSDNITEPYKDAIGKPLVPPDDMIDPTVFIDDDGQAYVKLNNDIISYTGSVSKVSLTTAGMIYAANCCSEDIRYSTGPSLTGPWTYRGVILPPEGKSFTNHPGIIDYKNNSYFFYHKGALQGGVGFGSGAKSFSARVSPITSGSKIELCLGSTSGTLVGTCSVGGTGSWTTWTTVTCSTVTCSVSGATGTQDLYLKFTDGSGYLFNFNWWQFSP
ncbi:glycosyl hydrolase family 43 domain-containing protein [Xylariaceae sp. FL1651]|nr:glycosyl hydrolase family 43 domain-containing protein [Xylariaceae sp. FL1651]